MDELRRELKLKFGDALEDDLLEECVRICTNNQLDAEDLFFKWEAATFRVTPHVVSEASISAVKQQLERGAQAKAKVAPSRVNLNGLLSKNLTKMAKTMKTERISKVQFTRGINGAATNYRYMYEKISERSEALSDRIDEFAELVQKHYSIPELSDPAASTEEQVTVVGRITFDADSSSAGAVKLNEASLTLESSRTMGSGIRVPLRFDTNVRVRGAVKGRGGAGFFPGAIVAVRGKNGGGGWFVVSEVLTLPSPSPNPQATATEPFSACVACGPFTSDNDLDYEPWSHVLEKIGDLRPDIIILIGPFIDSTHSCARDGDVEESPIALFQKIFLEPLRCFLDKTPGALAVLVPDVKDVLSEHSVFPQHGLKSNIVNDERIHLLSNPGTFAINGVGFGSESVDVLFHLRKEEFFRRMSEIHSIGAESNEALATDVMASLCRHLLEQRSYYPLFPVPHGLAHDVNLDVSNWKALKLDTGKDLPSILILPSRLKQFCKKVDGITFINPSTVSRNTFAVVKCVKPGNLNTEMCIEIEVIKLD